MTVITGPGVVQMRELAVKLRAADPKLKNELRRQFRQISAPTVRRVQTSIMDMASVGGGGHLRAEIAATVSATTRITRNGVRLDIVSRGSKMPPGQEDEATMPKHVDARGGWGHPVFARRGRPVVWVRQYGKAQWFENPIMSAASTIAAAAQAALDDTLRQLER